MLKLELDSKTNSNFRVLCLGSHCDDIEIGCGGTVLQLIRTQETVTFYWVVFSSDQCRAEEALESANAFLRHAKVEKIVIKNFKDSFFPFIGVEIKEFFEQLKEEFSPDLIFTHYRNDLHQDHRLISELTWNAFRDHLILEYEIPKYDGDFGSPNFFVHLDEAICQLKIQYILNNFKSQLQKDWFEESSFMSTLRLRGIESRSPAKYAEAFYCRKMVLGLGPERNHL